MIIWSGLGFLIIVIMIASGICIRFIFETITGDVQAFNNGNLGVTVTMFVTAILNFGLYKFLMCKKGRVVIDKETGQEIELFKNHSLFFIPVKWWTPIFGIVALVIASSNYF